MINRELPWHQLGKDVTGTTSSEEALNKSDLNWEVKGMPIFNNSGIEIPGYKANTRMDNDQVLGIVSNRYNIVQNRDAFAFTDSLLGEGVTYERGGLFHKGRSIWLLAKMPEKIILEDKVDPYMIFINSHEGTGSIKVALCPIRIACSNALNAQLKSAKRSWSAIHAGNVMYRLEEAKRSLGLAEDYMEALDLEANRLADKKMSDAEFEAIIDRIYPVNPEDSDRKIRNTLEIKNGLFECLKAPDIAKYKDTAYGKWMSVTDYFDHAESARSTDTFNQTRWENIATGHNSVDELFNEIVKIA